MAGMVKHEYITFLLYFITFRLNIVFTTQHASIKLKCIFLGLHQCQENERFYRDLNSDRRIQSPECKILHHRTTHMKLS